MAVTVDVVGPRGGTVDAGLAAYADIVVNFFAKELGIGRLKTNIKLKLHHNLFVSPECEGLCLANDQRNFVVDVALYGNWLRTLAHEMVHVKQFARGELDSGLTRWKSRNNMGDVDYSDQPWEKEALRLQDKLVMKWSESERY